jgi:nitrate reductase NapD
MLTGKREIDRRKFLTGDILPERDLASARPQRFFHISSAVVTARPEQCAEIARLIAAMPDTEVRAVEGSKIVVVMEGQSSGEIGSRLTTMALMDGVFSANMVFEQLEPIDDSGDDR